jgi:hypothetical protein
MSSQLPIKAVVQDAEKSAVLLAAGQIESSLAKSGTPVTVNCDFYSSMQQLERSQVSGIIITSLLPEVANYKEPWNDVEKRLRAQYSELAQNSSLVIFVLTVFRHVAGFEPDRCEQMRIRIRRLDFLAAEISREFGVMVVDIDRDLADTGAHRLQTDYRLFGKPAEFLAARCIALAVISAGLDKYASFEAQDTARQIVSSHELDFGSIATTEVKPSNVMSLGPGRRKQQVKTVVDADSESHSGWLVDLFLSGQFSVGDAISKLKGSVARRGVRASAVMLFAALHASFSRRTKA